MKVTLKCFATLSRFQPEDAESFEVRDGETMEQVVERLAIPKDEINLVFIDGVRVGWDAVPTDGCRVGIFPTVGGG